MFEKVFIENSSFIKKISYIGEEATISMGGREYTYNITPDTFINFLFSESKGKFYNKEIKHNKVV